jgi:hypothetical protein
MRAMSLPLAGKNGYINMLEIGDFEYVDPFIKMHDIYIDNGVWMEVNKQRLQFGEGGFNETEAWAIGQYTFKPTENSQKSSFWQFAKSL